MRPYAYDDELVEGLDRYYTHYLSAHERREPAYRHLVVAERSGGWLELVAAQLGNGQQRDDGQPDWGAGLTWLLQAGGLRQQAELRQQAAAQAARIQALEQELLWTSEQLEAARAHATWLERQASAARDELERIKHGRVMRVLRRLRP
jgi:hypothetical protein